MGELLHRIDKKNMIKWLAFIVIVFVVFYLSLKIIGKDQLSTRVEQSWIWWPIIIIAWKVITWVIAPFTWGIWYIIAGGLYTLRQAISFSLIGNFLWCSLAFYVGKKRWISALKLLFKPKQIKEIQHLINHMSSYKSFIKTRFLLFPLEDFINYAAGMSKIHYLPFIVISTIVTTIFSLVPILVGRGIL